MSTNRPTEMNDLERLEQLMDEFEDANLPLDEVIALSPEEQDKALQRVAAAHRATQQAMLDMILGGRREGR